MEVNDYEIILYKRIEVGVNKFIEKSVFSSKEKINLDFDNDIHLSNKDGTHSDFLAIRKLEEHNMIIFNGAELVINQTSISPWQSMVYIYTCLEKK